METIMFMVVGAVIGALVSEIYHRFEEIDRSREQYEHETEDIIKRQNQKIENLEIQLKRAKSDIEAQK